MVTNRVPELIALLENPTAQTISGLAFPYRSDTYSIDYDEKFEEAFSSF